MSGYFLIDLPGKVWLLELEITHRVFLVTLNRLLPGIPGKVRLFHLEITNRAFPVKIFTGLTVKARCNRAFHVTFNRAFLVKPGILYKKLLTGLSRLT